MKGGELFRIYAGDGSTLKTRDGVWDGPTTDVALAEPEHYLADEGLAGAVNVALALGQPLLVTGEPGTGKTQLGASIAHDLGLSKPLIFNAKTTSTARDLFYRYDGLAHFRDVQTGKGTSDAKPYVEIECLGLAILLASKDPRVDQYLPPDSHVIKRPVRSVVVIDEIDKAPRDLPNDVLNEIERMEFTIRETGDRFTADAQYRPIVILTSNSEKALPDAFLRRCIFYHIPFPNRERLQKIVESRLKSYPRFDAELARKAISHFERIREHDLRKPPATAELLAWLRILIDHGVDVDNPTEQDRTTLAHSVSSLAKNREDSEQLNQQLQRRE